MKRIILALVLSTAIYAAGIHVFTYTHEQAHVEVYEGFGCENVHVEYGYLDGGNKLAQTTAQCSKDMKKQINLANTNVHTVSRFAMPIYHVIVLFIVFKVTKLVHHIGRDQELYDAELDVG